MSWGSLIVSSNFQREAAATPKARSPIERRVAGMAGKDDDAERRCFRPGTSTTRRTSDDKCRGAVPSGEGEQNLRVDIESNRLHALPLPLLDFLVMLENGGQISYFLKFLTLCKNYENDWQSVRVTFSCGTWDATTDTR